MLNLNFDNRFIEEMPGDDSGISHSRQTPGVCWAAVSPTRVANPRLLACSEDMMRQLGIRDEDVHSDEFLAAFSGNRLLPGMKAYATCYGGHQFGTWAGQLGDGRAIGLGEVVAKNGQRWELQLKGAGVTPYSRRGDGRAVLRSSIREFLCSEAMHHLGIPTTRALSLIATGESVLRDMFYDGNPRHEPGAIVCRAAPSFTRFGHFEILASRGDEMLLKRLVDFTISRDFCEISGEDRFAVWFRQVCEKTASLVTQWQRTGFVHGVMNTDNMSIAGLTIDYGPYGWVDNFDPDWTPNTTDADMRRYGFGGQPAVARWNLERLADALELASPSGSVLDEGLAHFDAVLQSGMTRMLAAKLGLMQWISEDADLVGDMFDLMHDAQIDMTEFFRKLADVRQAAPDIRVLHSAFYREELRLNHADALNAWLARYAARLALQQDTDQARRSRMNLVNPRFILRNYLAQQAIDAALQEDMSFFDSLMRALRRPYDEDIPAELAAKRPDWAMNKPGCSTLSCSS